MFGKEVLAKTRSALSAAALSVTCAAVLTALSLSSAHAAALETVQIRGDKAGELVLVQDEFTLAPWQSAQLSGKARTVMHMAGRSSSRKMQDAFIDALKAAKFDAQYYQTTSIVDLSDALWGTTGLVESKLEQNKRNFPWSSVVLDREGQFRAAHQLAEKSSAVYVLDAKGDILFSQEGSLSTEDIEKVMALLRTEIAKIKAEGVAQPE